jgi:hypothetical protein
MVRVGVGVGVRDTYLAHIVSVCSSKRFAAAISPSHSYGRRSLVLESVYVSTTFRVVRRHNARLRQQNARFSDHEIHG